MVPHHVKVQAAGVHRMATDLTGRGAVRVGDRLFQEGCSPSLPFTFGVIPNLLVIRPLAIL